jgi:hypothetical protein
MASACHRDSTAADAMAVLLDSHPSEPRNSSNCNAEVADCSLSQHEKEMIEREYDDDDDAFFDNGSEVGQPDIATSSGDDEEDNQDRQEFIRDQPNYSNPMVTRNQSSGVQHSLKTNCWID